MARTSKGIDVARIKAELAKAGVAATQIKEITSSLLDKTRLRELERERRLLQRAIDKIDAKIVALGGTATEAAPTKKKARKRAATKQIPTDTVLAYLKKHKGGLKREDIAKGMKVESASLKQALTELVASKQVKTAGQRRGTTYSA